MRGGDESFWFSQPETNTAAKSAERAAAGQQTLGAYTQGIAGPVGRLPCAAVQHTSSTDFVIRA